MQTKRRNPLFVFMFFQAAVIISLAVFAGTAIAGDYSKKAMVEKPASTKQASNTIVDVAIGAGQFNTLATALTAAGLVDTLQGEGPFTVFAPTDAAFAKLPEGTVENLLKPENIDQLKAVLTYHVVSGAVPASEVVKLSKAKTVNGQSVSITTTDAGVSVDNATVTKTDINASNGVIHVIDQVILPK